jgi:release factor glutamine methyltransferase
MSVAAEISVEDLRRRLAAMLARAFSAEDRVGTPALDARLLLAHAIGIEAATLPARGDEPVAPDVEARAVAFIERRIAGEPVARIVGHQMFWSLDFVIGPETLLPRPDTETLVEAALDFVDRSGRRDAALSLLDIGTGSGAILLALLSELPTASGVAIDCAEAALDIARENAQRLGLDAQARFIACNWAKAIDGRFDLVLVNPPYIESGAICGLQVEVSEHDPHIALDGGPDGLDAYRAILCDLDRLLALGGRGFLEVGINQAESVSQLAEKCGFAAAFHRDLAGIERVVELHRVADI